MPSVRVPVAPSRRLLRSVAVASALACSAAVSAALPGAVAAADEAAGTTVVGQLVQVWAEGDHAEAGDHDAEGPLSYVETAAGEAVRVPTGDVEGLPAGATVSVTVGGQIDDAAAAEHGVEPARTVLASEVLAAAGPATVPTPPVRGVTNQVTVVLVAPAGAAEDDTTLADVVATVDGPVADFWAEQSNGAIQVGVTGSRGWTTTTAGCADPTALWNEAAAAVAFVPGDGKHLLLYVTDAAPDCAYALAEVGRAADSGGRLYVRDTISSVIAHELGHNFGLGHSSGRQCDGAVETGTCRTSAYRDLYDVMGVSWGQLGSLNAAQAARLGVLPDAQVQSVTQQGARTTVTLSPLAGRTGTRALRLTAADGVDHWLEYRTPTARDAWLTGGNRYRLDSGVLLRQAGAALPDTSLLLDGTPSPAARWDGDLQAALPVGTEIPVSGGNFTVVVRSVSAAGAVIDVVPSPAQTTGTPAPAPAAAPVGVVMSGLADGAGSVEAAAADAVPGEQELRQVGATTAALRTVAATGGIGPVLAAGAVLAGAAALLLLRWFRAGRIAATRAR